MSFTLIVTTVIGGKPVSDYAPRLPSVLEVVLNSLCAFLTVYITLKIWPLACTCVPFLKRTCLEIAFGLRPTVHLEFYEIILSRKVMWECYVLYISLILPEFP